MQNEVFDKLYKINRKYKDVKISDVGCYELKYEDVKKISKKEMTKILFKSINDRVLLSRNSIYYDFEYFHSYIDLFIKLIIEKEVRLRLNKLYSQKVLDFLWIIIMNIIVQS